LFSKSSKGQRVVRTKLADGTTKEYVYPKYAGPKERYLPETIGGLLTAYRLSPEWLALKPSTKSLKNIYLRHLEELRAHPVADLRRAHLIDIRNAINVVSGPGAANAFIRTTSALFSWAIEQDRLEHNPVARLKRLRGGELRAFTRQEFEAAEASLPEQLRRVLVLGRWTGQRRGDLCRLTWAAYDGTTLRFTQQKTGVRMALFVHPDLKAELDAWKTDATSTQILTNFKGRPWTPNSLTQQMGEQLGKLGLSGLNVHGLRKLAATIVAEEGATVHEIAKVTGHKTLAMVQHYTASAEQERLAKAAIMRLPKRSEKN
jgi:integrase